MASCHAYDVGTEKRYTNNPQTVWMGGAVWSRWNFDGPWSIAIRPEFYWDPDGELTGSEQVIGAITTTAEYKLPIYQSDAQLRLEYRHDTSSGKQGGFYNPNAMDAQLANQLVPNQNLFFFSVIWNFERRM